uniref:Baseplate protein J-like domain-containing protein n=1 Tax=candidate division WWE3 bacterium TaxID=2053526 RepID=A0A7C4XSV9_UNCKA
MEKLNIEIHEDVISVIDRIRDLSSSDVELIIPDGAVLFDNGLNLKLIKKEGEKLGKKILFSTTDFGGKHLISLVDETGSLAEGLEHSDFTPIAVSLDEVIGEKHIKSKTWMNKNKWAFSFAPVLGVFRRLKVPKVNISKPNLNVVWIVAGLVFALLIIGAGSWFLWTVPKANIELSVNSQPLVKSIQISVENGAKNSAASRTLEGRVSSAVVTEAVKTKTTGTKQIGEKAEGKIKIINRTTTEKEFEKGEELYSKDDDDLVYVLDDDVTVPAAQLEDPGDPLNSPLVPGNAEVNITARDIGKKYNLSKGETLEFDDYKSIDYVAEAKEDISGGMSEEVKVVVQADLDKLTADLASVFKGKSAEALKSAVQPGWILVVGSESSSSISKKFNKKVGDVADEVELSESMNYQGLSYSSQGLNSLLEELLDGFVPEDFELSDEGRDIKAEVLGNTDKTILNTNKADLQVTIKANIIPIIDSERIKTSLLGTKVSEAERLLNEVKNVKNYGINIDPNIPFFRRIPKNPENVSLNVNLE